MSNTINVGNFSVECFHSPSPVIAGESIKDYESTTLVLIPDEGYSIVASNFSAQTPLPDYVQSVTFEQSSANPSNVLCTVNLTPGATMPAYDINIDLCINGLSEKATYCVSGVVEYIQSSNVVPAVLSNNYNVCGVYEETSNVFTQSVSASPGYYFDTAPTISLVDGDITNYTVKSENVLDNDGNIVNTVFTIDYKFLNNNVTDHIWHIVANAKIIYVPVIEITSYNINTNAFSDLGGQRYYSIYGSEGAAWTLTASNSNGINNILLEDPDTDTFVNVLSGTLDSSGVAEVLIVIPESTTAQEFDLTISGDLASPFGQPTTVTLNQYVNVTQTYAASSPSGLVVTPGSYIKNGFTYSSFTGEDRPLTSIAWTVAPSNASNLVALKNESPVSENVSNNDIVEISFATSGTSNTHVLSPLDAGAIMPNIAGWKFIGTTDYSPTISALFYDSSTNAITFSDTITVVAGQSETIGNNKGNLIEIGLEASPDEPNVIVAGNILVNQFGFADNTFTFLLDQFLIESSIPTITTSAITNVQSGSSDSGGESISDNYANITSKGVEWSEFSDFSVILGTTTDGYGTDDYISSMTSLVEGTTYYVRAYATNFSGTGYGQTVSFLHPVSVSIPTLTTSLITNSTGTEADSGGESIYDNGGAITAKGIQWSTFSDFNTLTGALNSGSGTADFTAQMTSLSPGTTYYVRAYATNSAGTGYGNTVEFVSNITFECDAQQTSGGPGITDYSIQLDSDGGVIAFLFWADNQVDKMEIIHGNASGTKKATTSIIADNNYGPFDNVYGTATTNPADVIPSPANVANIDQFIGGSKGTMPTRQTQFNEDTGFILNSMSSGGTTYQQIVWWKYTALDFAINQAATVRITGTTPGTVWRALRVCCPDGNCIVDDYTG